MSHSSGNILLHMIFSAQGRRPLIKPDFRADLFAYLGGIMREMHGTALIIDGTADHVHMLVRVRPAHSGAEIARVVKANSSRWVHEKWDPEFAWQTGYGVFSVSESNVAAVTKYIAEQRSKEHHQKHSFQEEFVAFLKKNNVAYDATTSDTSGISLCDLGVRLFRPYGALLTCPLFCPTACAVGCILSFFRRFAAGVERLERFLDSLAAVGVPCSTPRCLRRPWSARRTDAVAPDREWA